MRERATDTDWNILVVNPGSTSSKVAVFHEDDCRRAGSLPARPVTGGTGIWDEFPSRLAAIRDWLVEEDFRDTRWAAVVGRGGLLRPLEGGTYRVTDAMVSDARKGVQGAHASNLGCALARALAGESGQPVRGGQAGDLIPAFVVDPVSTDEFGPLARFSGLREIPRRSLSHALSIHSLVREVCREAGRSVEGSRFIVAHLGGGISVCPVVDGRIRDCNNANSGGPFSPSRAGGLPVQELLNLTFSGAYTHGDLRRMTTKEGGLMSYLGTDDAREVEVRIGDGDEGARTVYETMAYQIAKEIGAMAAVMRGSVERILLTGGLARSTLLTGWIEERVAFIAPVEIWPEVEEMRAMALGALRVLRGEEEAKDY